MSSVTENEPCDLDKITAIIFSGVYDIIVLLRLLYDIIVLLRLWVWQEIYFSSYYLG